MKKAQVTPLIIVAVLVVAVLIIYFIIGNSEKKADINPEVKPVYDFVQGCLEENSKEAILEVSKYGGYFNIPENSLENGIPYYVIDGKDLMPSKEIIEEEIADYIDSYAYLCLKEFSDFPDLEINDGQININSKISREAVDFDINYPLSVIKGGESYQIGDFKFSVRSRLGTAYDESRYLVNDLIRNPDSICITCVRAVSEDSDLFVSTVNYDADVVIFTIKDEYVKIDNQELVFSYAVKLKEVE